MVSDPLPKFSICAHCDDDIMLVDDEGSGTSYIHASDGRQRCHIYAEPVLCRCRQAACPVCIREVHGEGGQYD